MTTLAYLKRCDGCRSEIFMAICRDGRWRPFERDEVPAAPEHVWAWRKREGMEETDRAAGHLVHFCADFHNRIDLSHPLAEEASA